jgi:TonB-dependent SusC/RagA subfamily outer membrane receptor
MISKKESSTGMASVDEKNMDNNSYKDIYDMIRGKVPGVSVIGSTIKIRGIRSVNGSSDPMFIVDGAETFSINDISPSQVNSITVLKGTESAIYGSRGANGVIVITLKK